MSERLSPSSNSSLPAKMRVLVFGARGFIGGHVCRALLQQGHSVVALTRFDRFPGNLDDLPAELKRRLTIARMPRSGSFSINDFPNAEYLVHAGLGLPGALFGGTRRWAAQRDSLRTFLGEALSRRWAGAVFVSVSGTVGGKDESKLISEASPGRPTGRFLGEKLAIEREIFRWVERGLNACIVNPPFCVGPNDSRPSSGKLIRFLAASPVLAFTNALFNAVDVRDVASGIVAALQKGKPGERYLLTGENLSFGEFAERVRLASGNERTPVRIPDATVLWAALGSELTALLLGGDPSIPWFSLDIVRHGHGRYCCAKAERNLGFKTRPLNESIAAAIASYRSMGYLPSMREGS